MAKNKKNTIIKGGEQPKPEKKRNVKVPNIKSVKLNSRKHKLISGTFFLIFGIYLFIALTSYLFTWTEDQDKLLGSSFSEYVFFGGDIETQNWLGRLGAYTAHFFMYKGFGLSSFLFALLFANMGANLTLNFKPFKNLFLLKIFLTFGVWLSICLGYLNFGDSGVFGGSFGTQIALWLNGVLGKFGTFLLLIAALFGNIVVMFDPDWSTIQKWLSKGDEDAASADEETIIQVNKEGELVSEVNTTEEQEPEQDIILTSTIKEDEQSAAETTEPEIIVEHEAPITEEEVEVVPAVAETEVSDTDNRIQELEVAQTEVETSTPLKADLGESIDFEASVTAPTKTDEDEEEFSVEIAPEEVELSQKEISKVEEFGEYDPTLDLSSYQPPPIDMLEEHGSGNITINKEELELNKNRIVETLEQFKIGISKIKATVGPTVTLYEIIPAPGVRISKIKNLEDDIALSLAALGIRIIAPIPGKGTIGIEVPSSSPSVVSMKSIISSEKFQNNKFELPIVLGKTISNETFTYDLAKMPHLLIAGATGQGKSVGLNAILVSLLYKKHPSQLKFVLVDPKKVELTLYNKIERHFLAKLPDSEDAIITDNSKVINTLNSLCIEMDSRYELLKDAQVRNIKEYNAKFIARKLNPEKGHKFLPYIVLVVDEFADLIMTAGKEVEVPIARLAQLARAIGIHLIIATQRPSVNVITGTIKANFPARIAFRVMQKIDSRTILDATGADQLIGRGDMLISTGNDITRIQCGFVDTPEVEEICDFIGEQRGYSSAFLLPEYVGEEAETLDIDEEDRDVLFEDAASIVVMHQQGSASLLQRKLKLGYNRAGRLIDQLEAAGIVGPFKGSKAREVMIADELALQDYLNKDKA